MIDCGKCKHGEISLFYLIGVNSGQMSIECKINLETLPEKCIRYQKINWIKYVFRMLLPKRKFQEIKEMRRNEMKKLQVETNGKLYLEENGKRLPTVSANGYKLNILEGSTEILLSSDEEVIKDFSSIEIVGWQQTLQKFIKVKSSLVQEDPAIVTPLDIYVIDLDGNHIGYLRNIFVNCIDNKVAISFDKYEYDKDNNSWFTREYK